MTRSIVVTGCDAAHYDLATDLITSLRDARGPAVTIGFIHVGEDPVPPVIEAAADHIVHIPDAQFLGDQRRGFRLAYLALKPRLPEFFPGYDVYIWLDGDTWVQNPAGLDQLIHCAGLADICMHPESDPNYFARLYPRQYMYDVYTSIYGADDAQRYAGHHILNSGVFAAAAASPIWKLWSDALADMRERSRDRDDFFFSDQIPLHRLIVDGRISVHPLRAINNWLLYLSAPMVNLERKRLLAPSYPYEEINILHLVSISKDARYRLGDSDREITFRYRDIKALFNG